MVKAIYIFITFYLLSLSACAMNPSVRFLNEADRHGITHRIVKGLEHRLIIFQNITPKANLENLHIYLDGDGSPWLNHRWISTDPTSRRYLVLQLMALDQNPSILVGRPCYYQKKMANNCSPKLWTSHRYSEEVVTELSAAIDNYLNEFHFKFVTLIGYSGGGTLARILADRIKKTNALIMIAANLDTEKWTSLHGYTPLWGSINPATLSSLPSHIKQIYLFGENDKNVPVDIFGKNLSKGSRVQVFQGFKHTCCWDEIWLDILQRF